MAITYTTQEEIKESSRLSLSSIDYDLINFVYSKIEDKCGCYFFVNTSIRELFYTEPMKFLDKNFIITQDFLVDLLIKDDGGFMGRPIFIYDPRFYLNEYCVNKDTIKFILNDYMTIEMLKEYELDDLIKLYDMYSIDKDESLKIVERVYIEFYSNKFKTEIK